MSVRRMLLWPGGKQKAFTLSYDDGVEQDIPFIDLLKKYGLQATFNLNPGVFGQKSPADVPRKFRHDKIEQEKIAQIYEGFEISNHTVSHPWLDQLPSGTIAYETAECRKRLEKITGSLVTGFAYPFGAYNDTVIRVLRDCGITYSRTVVSTRKFAIPKDFLQWHATCHHDDPDLFKLTEDFLSAGSERQWGSPLLFYVWGHSYEFDRNENWEKIEEFFRRIAGKEDVWYASNGAICDYVNAADQLLFSADGSLLKNPTALPIWLSVRGEAICVKPGETVELGEIRNV